MASDGQVTLGQTVVKHQARKVRRLYHDRVLAGFAGAAADGFALFQPLREQARGAPRQPRARGRRAGARLAHRSRAAPARGDDARRRRARDVPALGHRRSHRAGRRRDGDRIGRPVRDGRGARARPAQRARRARHRRAGDGDRRRHLHLHERPARRWKSSEHDAYLRCPNDRRSLAESLTPREIVAELDKYVVGQAQGEARGGDRAAQPLPAAAAAAGHGRRSRAEEHPDDRADRRRQDRDRAPAGAAGAVAVPQGRSVEVHRGRLRRPRRRVDGARPRRDRRQDGARGARGGSARARRGRPPRSGCSICCCRPCAAVAVRRGVDRGADGARPRGGDARDGCASSCAPAGSTRKTVEIEVRERAMPSFELIQGSSVEEIGVNLRDMLPGMFQGRTRRRKLPVPEAFEHLTQEEAQKLIDMDGVAQRRDRARRAGRHHLRRRDRQDRRPRGRAGPGRQPRGRAARHPADRRRHDGQHEVRHGADRSHPVHRRRRVSRLEAVGSDSRAAGPVSDSRRARGARARRVRPHPDRAEERAHQAVHRR